MYRFYIAVAVFWFAFQATLYGKYARALDGISLLIIRNVSLIWIGALVLFRVPKNAFAIVPQHSFTITRTACFGVLHLLLNYQAYKYVPVWVANILKKWVTTIVWFVIWYLLLSEMLSRMQYLLLWIIMVASLYISGKRIHYDHLENHKYWIGIIYIVISWIFSTLARYGFKLYSADMNTFLASYILEASVGVVAAFIFPLYKQVSWFSLMIPDKKTLGQILAISVVTMITTISYTQALQWWSFSLSNALILCNLPLICLFSALFYHEHLQRKQRIAIISIVICLIMLKLIT